VGHVRLGLRPQLLLLVTVLLGLTFAPLLWTATVITRVSMARAQAEEARGIGRTVGHVMAHSSASLSNAFVSPIVGLERQSASGGLVERLGIPSPEPISTKSWESCRRTQQGHQELLWCETRHEDTVVRVATVLRDVSHEGQSLFQLLGLYVTLLAVVLMLAIYFAITALIVRPLDALRDAARRVAGGGRQFSVPRMSATELVSLGESVQVMTTRLLQEEEELRHRIDEVHQATEGLRQAQDRLVRSERLASVGRLAAGLAHEIGNPIAALIGFEEMLIQGGLSPEETSDFLLRMRRETERIHRILRDLLDFARPSSPTSPDGCASFGDVAQAITETCSLVSPQKSWKGVTLQTLVESNLPLVRLEREKLVQLLLNLLMNAADATGPEGQVVLSAERVEQGVRLTVTDNGPGVAAEVRSRLFEPFVSTKDVGQGTGLGLAVCRGLVEGAGGNIWLDETFAEGARFVCELPLATELESVPGE
jgi:two-component system, NtrC family, sensor kinase